MANHALAPTPLPSTVGSVVAAAARIAATSMSTVRFVAIIREWSAVSFIKLYSQKGGVGLSSKSGEGWRMVVHVNRWVWFDGLVQDV
jgi:hypothetical protein